jgi:anaerobilin synthase
MHLNPARTLMKFDRQLPIYNWLYPLKGQSLDTLAFRDAFARLDHTPIHSRALYFHIPFCETICSFCSLNRGLGVEGEEAIDRYVDALVREVHIKAAMPAVTAVPPRVIWFGGGTPSILTADQIRRLGAAIHDAFDLSRLEEFTVEMEVKSITAEKCEAFRDIGVNKARFGLQTFNPRYRDVFKLTATLDQTYAAADLLARYFDQRGFDILYGMHGQTLGEFAADIQQAVDMGTQACEFYPVNHLAAPNALHTGYRHAGLAPVPYIDKMGMTLFLNQYMRASGFQLYNGHGYVRLPDPGSEPQWITDRYSNMYHEYCWAYHDDDLIGFGSSGVTQSLQWTIMNDEHRASYTRRLLDHDDIDVEVTEADHVPYERGVVLTLPYHGAIRKDRIPWDRIDADILTKLATLVADGMIAETPDRYVITELGWMWYVNLMYYLSGPGDQKVLDDYIALRSENPVITDGDTRLTPVPLSAARPAGVAV